MEVKEDFPGAEDEERREEVGGSDSHASTDHALDDDKCFGMKFDSNHVLVLC